MRIRDFGLLAIIGLAALGTYAVAQIYGPPQVLQINSGDLFQDLPNGAVGPGNTYASATLLGNYSASQPGNAGENALVGGDFTTNLFQRATTKVLASPAAVAYTAPDRWFTWGGTNTPVTLSQQTGATDITQAYGASLRVNKASGAGVVQVCVAQEVLTANSYRFQGQTAEFDFHAKAGSGFSAAASNLAVYILTGTNSNEGSVNAAFSINAGGGGAAAWTGATVLGGTNGFLVPITTSWGRYTVAAPIPLTATEIAVAICYTPVGTGTSTDWFEFTGAQLVPNTALTTAAGSAGAYIGLNDLRAKAFLRRPASLEASLQQSYYYQVNEPGTAAVATASGLSATTATCKTVFYFPGAMVQTPTLTTNAAATTWGVISGTTVVALSTPFAAIPTGGASTLASAITWTTGTTQTQYDACLVQANATPGGGYLGFTAEL